MIFVEFFDGVDEIPRDFHGHLSNFPHPQHARCARYRVSIPLRPRGALMQSVVGRRLTFSMRLQDIYT
jgi:hypothetical protein